MRRTHHLVLIVPAAVKVAWCGSTSDSDRQLQRWPQTSWDPLRCCSKQRCNLKSPYLYTTAIVSPFIESYADPTSRCAGASFGQVSLEKVGVDINTCWATMEMRGRASLSWQKTKEVAFWRGRAFHLLLQLCGFNVLKTELSASPNCFQRKIEFTCSDLAMNLDRSLPWRYQKLVICGSLNPD